MSSEKTTWRENVEKRFEHLGHWLFRNRIKTILITLAAAVCLSFNVRNITMDAGSDSFFHENDPALLDYNAFRDQFGLDERIVIAVRAQDVFDEGILKKLQALHNELEAKVPFVDDITSLISARNTRGEVDRLIVEDLLEHWPQNEDELNDLKKRALENPQYKNMLLSEDGTFTTIIIKLDAYSSKGSKENVLDGFDDAEMSSGSGTIRREYLTDKETGKAVSTVRKVLKRHRSPHFKMYLAGSPVVMNTVRRAMKKAIGASMQAGALGIKVNCAGRLGGAEMARTENYKDGMIPLHTFRADISYGFAQANTTFGTIGVKVWIYKGEVFRQDTRQDAGVLLKKKKNPVGT